MAETIGRKLKEIRQNKGISLDEIALKTHISIEYLKAIEDGDLDALPSQVQMRGFLRLIASELGVSIGSLEVSEHQIKEKYPTRPEKQVNQPVSDPAQEEALSGEEPTDDESQPNISGASDAAPLIPSTPEEQSDQSQTELQTSTLMFKAIGKTLVERRELLSLSINDIDEHIRIRPKYITDMEAGRFAQLPSPVQAKGMLQNYAEFLNLDSDQLLLSYADALQMQRQERQTKRREKSQRSAKALSPTRLQLKKFFSLDLLVIAALFIIFSTFVVWGANRIMDADNPQDNANELPEVADVLLATGSPTSQLTPTFNQTSEEEPGEETTLEAATPIFTALPNDNPINIIIIPRQRAWVQVSSDSEIIYTGRVLPGNAYDYSGEETVEVLTGNAGALQIYFNDQDIGSPGLIGQVVTLIFTENGLVLPTPTNTPTITETPQASPSPTLTPSPTAAPTITLSPTPSSN